MAAGDVRQGKFTRTYALGATSVASLIGGTTYSRLVIKAHTDLTIGNNGIDSESGTGTLQGYRMAPNEVVDLENTGATAGLIDGGKINVRAVRDSPPASFTFFAIDNV